MIKPIPETIVEETWQNVAGFSPDRAKKEMMKLGNNQPELLAFVMDSAKEMGQEVIELGIYMFLVVYRMFQKSHGKIKKISSEEIIKCYEFNEGLIEKLGSADEKFLDRVASVQTSRRSYVVNYVVDALMEEEKGEDALTLTDEQKGFLFLLLKTVIDTLDAEYDSYTGMNPKTGEKIFIKANKLPFFKVGKKLKERADMK